MADQVRDSAPESGDLEGKVAARTDLGLKNRLLDLLAEPINPFSAADPRPLDRAAAAAALLIPCLVSVALLLLT